MSDITSSVRLSTTKPSRLSVRIQPFVKPLGLREPRKALVVCLACSNNTTRLGHTLHLPEDAHGVLDVLKDLVAEDDVEGCVGVGKSVGIRDLKGAIRDATAPCHVGSRALQDRLDGIDARDFAFWHELGEVGGDGARAAADVQDGVVRLQVGQEEGGAILCGPSGVAVYHAGVVTVSVSRLFLSTGHLDSDLP